MPDVKLSAQSRASAGVGLAALGALPDVGGSGPAPGWVPPPPPPPPTPLQIVTMQWRDLSPKGVLIEFDQMPWLDSLPTWHSTENPTSHCIEVDLNENGFHLMKWSGNNAGSVEYVIPPNAPGFRSPSGGYIAPGTYTMPIPPV